jgi:hypothetical protein
MADIDERTKKAFDFAADLVKQIMTLSTAVVTVTATAAQFVFTNTPAGAIYWMIWSWFIFLASIILGILGLMSLTGSLDPIGRNTNTPPPTIYDGKARFFIGGQIITFGVALLLVVIFSMRVYSSWNEAPNQSLLVPGKARSEGKGTQVK